MLRTVILPSPLSQPSLSRCQNVRCSNDRIVLQQVVQGDDVEIACWRSVDVCLDTTVSMAATWSHPCTPAVRNLKELSRTNVDNRSSERCETEDGSRCPEHGRRLAALR